MLPLWNLKVSFTLETNKPMEIKIGKVVNNNCKMFNKIVPSSKLFRGSKSSTFYTWFHNAHYLKLTPNKLFLDAKESIAFHTFNFHQC